MVTLLIIDDDNADRKAVVYALKALGSDYKIQEARDGRQGLELALAHSFDCILIDYHLPDMSGFDLLGQLRELLDITAPIVMLTGEGNKSVAVEAMKRGAYDYLPKSQLRPDLSAERSPTLLKKARFRRNWPKPRKNLNN